jgi:hypothetical protein
MPAALLMANYVLYMLYLFNFKMYTYRAQAAQAIDDFDVMRKEWTAMTNVIRNLNPATHTNNDENMTRVMLEQTYVCLYYCCAEFNQSIKLAECYHC